MPYIQDLDVREIIKDYMNGSMDLINDSGRLNLAVFILGKLYIQKHGESYENWKDCLFAIEGACDELKRRYFWKYEDAAIIRNGDVEI